jgi:hypothetical protein
VSGPEDPRPGYDWASYRAARDRYLASIRPQAVPDPAAGDPHLAEAPPPTGVTPPGHPTPNLTDPHPANGARSTPGHGDDR